MRLADRVAIVTGGGSGIGRAIALAFAREGAHLLGDVDGERARAVAEEVRADGGAAVPVAVDVANSVALAALVERAVSAFGRLDIMVNNAGTTALAPAEELAETDWRRVVDVNQTAVFLGSQIAARQLIRQGSGGTIINISSMYGRRAVPLRVAYCTTKAAVIAMTEVLAVEWAKYRIRVNAICPGFTETELFRSVNAQAAEELVSRVPLRRLAQPSEIASVAVFLASEEASFVTGHALVVDGGWLPYGGTSPAEPPVGGEPRSNRNEGVQR
jgi:NAD(P)-dependent dehydrogenase (short-subunit alcohol dehydrogenase family)